MDFSYLPDTAFVKIINYLPFEECIRVGRVNKSFRRISQLVTSSTKSLHLEKVLFRNLYADQLTVILDLCSQNLELISFPYYFLEYDDVAEFQLAMKFANYQFHRLRDITISYPVIGGAVFNQLLRNAPNLENLVRRGDSLVFPNIMNNNLKKLKLLGDSNDATLQSLTGRSPNLTELDIGMRSVSTSVLDEFLASVPQVNRLELHQRTVTNIIFEDLVNLWHLPLTLLNINLKSGTLPGDDFVQKVAISFPHLQSFTMERSMATENAIAALSKLQELEILNLQLGEVSTDDRKICQLVNCKKLRKLDLSLSVITSGTLIALFQGCHQLEHIGVLDICQVNTEEEAAAVLESLSGISQREITIFFYPWFGSLGQEIRDFIWKSETVKEEIRKLGETCGLKIEIQ